MMKPCVIRTVAQVFKVLTPRRDRLAICATAEPPSALPSRVRNAAWAIVFPVLLFLSTHLHAHTGNQNVFYEGNIGPYQARIMIEKPEVVPGLSQITVRMLSGTPERITVLPLKWNLGKQGAPTPDIAQPVRGEPSLHSAELWFMESGSQSVAVNMSGPEGSGEVQIPVAIKVTKVETLPAGLGTLLTILMLLLVAIFLGIVRGAVRESALATGERPTRKRVWMSRVAVVLAATLISGILYGGKMWWNAEAQAYRNNVIYHPTASTVEVRTGGKNRTLRLELAEDDMRRRSPVVPDHGKLMHMVLVSKTNMNAMAHVHPLKLNRRTFVLSVPENLPAGDYSLYAEVTYETGFNENVVSEVVLPEPPISTASAAAGIAVESDPDDTSIVVDQSAVSVLEDRRRIADLGDGFVIEWLDSTVINAGEDLSLRFQVRSTIAGDQPVLPQFYMGMLGHLFLRSHDGHLFTHLHPAGSYSMASQQLFEMRAEGKAPNEVNYGTGEAQCEIPGVDASLAYWSAQKGVEADYSFSFPWKFMNPGDYRIWIQVKVGEKIRTGVFDVEVWPGT